MLKAEFLRIEYFWMTVVDRKDSLAECVTPGIKTNPNLKNRYRIG